MKRVLVLVFLSGCLGPAAAPTPQEAPEAPAADPAAPAWSVVCDGKTGPCIEPYAPGSPGAGAWVAARDGTLHLLHVTGDPSRIEWRTSGDGRAWQKTVVPVHEAWGLEEDVMLRHPVLWFDPAGLARLYVQAVDMPDVPVYVNSGPDSTVYELLYDGAWHVGAFWPAQQVDGAAGQRLLLREDAWGKARLLALKNGTWQPSAALPCDVHRATAPSDLTRPAWHGGIGAIECNQLQHKEWSQQVQWNATEVWLSEERLPGHDCEMSRHYGDEVPIAVAGRPPDNIWSVGCNEAVVALGEHVLPAASWGTWMFDEHEVQPASVAIDGWSNLHLGAVETSTAVCAGCTGSAFHLFGFSPDGQVLYHRAVPQGLLETAPRSCASTPFGQGFFHACAGGALLWWFTQP